MIRDRLELRAHPMTCLQRLAADMGGQPAAVPNPGAEPAIHPAVREKSIEQFREKGAQEQIRRLLFQVDLLFELVLNGGRIDQDLEEAVRGESKHLFQRIGEDFKTHISGVLQDRKSVV